MVINRVLKCHEIYFLEILINLCEKLKLKKLCNLDKSLLTYSKSTYTFLKVGFLYVLNTNKLLINNSQ